jgi:cation:H+ antiporter
LNGATDIAQDYEISERVVSVSVVALGTSLPELVASVVAAKKGQKDLAIGNVVGSNIFNILGVIGFTSIVSDIRVEDIKILQIDFVWVIGFTLVLYPLAILFNKNSLGKRAGGILFSAYLIYMIILVINKGS